MNNVVRRTDFAVLRRVSDARLAREFPDPPWANVRDAELDPLIGSGTPDSPDVPKIYWIFDAGTDVLREMDAAEKAAADADGGNVAAAQSTRLGQLAIERDQFVQARYSLTVQGQFQALLPTATGTRLTTLDSWFAWLETVYAAWHAATVAVNAAADVQTVEAVQIDFAALEASDPGVTLEQLMGL